MYTVGAVVDGYELTASGEWVRVSPTAGSPYALGDVVDGYLLDDDLTWVALRRSPSAPYRAGDVVDDHVLTPAGDWVPLASCVRERVGGRGSRPRVAEPVREATAAERAQRRAQEQQAAARRAEEERRAASRAASAEQRAAEQRAVAERAAQERAEQQRSPQRRAAAAPTARPSATASDTQPARRQYRVGDVVNGHVLTPDMRWVPVGDVPRGSVPGQVDASAGSGAASSRERRSGVPGFVPLLVLGFVALQVLRACGA